MPPKKTVNKSTSKTSTGKPAKPGGTKPGAKSTTKKTSNGKGSSTTGEVTKKMEEVSIKETEKKEIGVSIALKDVPDVLLEDRQTIKESGRSAVLVIDKTGNVATFLRHRHVNCLSSLATNDMQPQVLRPALLGAIRYGKPLMIDMLDTDMYPTISEHFDKIYEGLMEDVLSNEIILKDKYSKLIRDTDGEEYTRLTDFVDDIVLNFRFIISTKCEPSTVPLEKFYTVRVG